MDSPRGDRGRTGGDPVIGLALAFIALAVVLLWAGPKLEPRGALLAGALFWLAIAIAFFLLIRTVVTM